MPRALEITDVGADRCGNQGRQLASDRTSCRSALANQVRLLLHTVAFWLMLTLRDAIPKQQTLATAEFATLRMRLLKIAARVAETATRVRIALRRRLLRSHPLSWHRAQLPARRAVSRSQAAEAVGTALGRRERGSYHPGREAAVRASRLPPNLNSSIPPIHVFFTNSDRIGPGEGV